MAYLLIYGCLGYSIDCLPQGVLLGYVYNLVLSKKIN